MRSWAAVVDLSVVIVNWNVEELLCRCLSSLLRPRSFSQGLEVIVVDNASADGSLEMVRSQFAEVRLIASESNEGFGRASNRGWAASSGRYVLFLNPDTEVLGDALTVMVSYLDVHESVAVVGPQLLYPGGQIQSSRRRFHSLAMALFESTVLEQWWPSNPYARRYRMADIPDDVEQQVDWLVGACLLVRRAVLADTGGFDEGFFMYSEEMDLCRRIKEAGGQVVFLPGAKVLHHEGKSSEQVVPARHVHFETSKVLYFRRHHGRLQAEFLRLFLLATYLWRMLGEAVKWSVGHKRPLRAARVAAYARVLQSRLVPARTHS